MSEVQIDQEVELNTKSQTQPNRPTWLVSFLSGLGVAILLFAVGTCGYFLGIQKNSVPASTIDPRALLSASTASGGKDMAVATARIDDDTEGVYFLDFKTGDLQCWVYYPRNGQFGAQFASNISVNLPGGKNAEYLMVTGTALPAGGANNSRPASSLVYVVDTQAGAFAAYTFPWNKSAQTSGQVQGGQLIYIGGGKIRN